MRFAAYMGFTSYIAWQAPNGLALSMEKIMQVIHQLLFSTMLGCLSFWLFAAAPKAKSPAAVVGSEFSSPSGQQNIQALPTPPIATTKVTTLTLKKPLKININTSTVAQIAHALQGIGIHKAKAIVAYREAYGNFTSVDDLVEVKGIGNTILTQVKDVITLE